MSSDETIESRQDSELEALKAIYGNEVRDLRKKKAWNRWAPLDVSLALRPLIGSSGRQEIHIGLDLRIRCSERYPNIPPDIELKNTRGMSTALVDALLSELKSRAVELTGEVMIFELAQHVQGFLHQHNKPATKSFYEEMILRNKQIERMEQERLQIEFDRKKQCVIDEVHRRQEILKLEKLEKRREYRLSSDNSSENSEPNRRRSTSGNRRCNNSCEMSDELICSHLGTEVIEFSNNGLRVVTRGRCIHHSQQNSVVYSGIDQESGQLLNITEWNVEIKPDVNVIQRQISSIENELNYLVKLKHYNLAHYLNITHAVIEQENKVIIQVLQEFIFGINCRGLYLQEDIPIEIDMFRHIADGVLNALDFLHRNNVVHKDLTGSCVYLCRNGVVKVSDYSLDKRLSDLVVQTHSSNYNKKTDIYKFGLLMLSLIKGSDVSNDSIQLPSHVSHELHDFLDRCLSSEEKDRYTALQLLNHSFLKVPLTRLSPHRHIEEKVPDRRNSSPDIQAADIKMLAQSHSSGQSRVGNEFELLDHLGKGAYGDVFKVQNKLDQGYYALKRIELNPRNKQINKKIIREVKLLSRLNHENVVRYYNSWIETATINRNEPDESTTSSVTTPSVPESISIKKETIFKEDDSLIEKLAPPVRDVEWSISYGHKAKISEGVSSSTSEESSDDDDDENWGLGLKNLDDSSDSDCIEFEQCDLSKTLDITDSKDEDTVDSCIKLSKEIQFMYIQMEFCEKSTLRNAIDTDLYLDNDRVWRLFREIVDGLVHIHQQGMIHRDLKPMNIFLDYNDNVKIGDFGLATTNFLAKPSDTLSLNKSYNDTEGSHDGGGDPSMTGHIGTALYVAPELTSTAKAVYNQKVDIYSLGVIFFEMCYKPLKTGMERISVLTRLRSNEIIFPTDFQDEGTTNQQHIIRWLLDHNVSKRPASQELLQSDKLPPPVLEECKLRELVRHTLSNSQLKGYKYLVESCFKQMTTQAQDITYDKDISVPNSMKNLQTYNHIRAVIVKVFEIHGGQNLSTPLLMPKSKYYEGVDSCVKLMTHSGSVVSIPHDLRIPFARYVAWNGVTSFRRYSIERVYREKRVFGFIPRELYECAFDIVTSSSGNFMSDAEILYILNEVIDQVPGFKNKNLHIRLNHTLLLKAILVHCGVKDKHNELYNILSDAREGKATKQQVRYHLITTGLSEYSIDLLFSLLETELSLSKMACHLQIITKKRNSEASQYAKQALQELRAIVHNAEALGVTFNMVVCPGLVYNIQQYSGMLCQLVCEIKKKHRHGMDVLAAGGRYDAMISSYRSMMVQANMLSRDIKQSAVGVSISLDKLMQAMEKDHGSDGVRVIYLDTVICSLGGNPMLKEKSSVLRSLWAVGIRSCLIEAVTSEDIQEQCSELNVPHVIILKDSEPGQAKVRSWENDRFQERKFKLAELVENMQRIIKSGNDGNCDQNNSYYNLSRSDSKISHSERCDHNQDAYVNIRFVTAEKLPANTRRKYENQIRSQMACVFKKLIGDVLLLAVSLEGGVVKIIASYLDFDSEEAFYESVKLMKERYQKHKEYINEICDEIYKQKNTKSNPVIILYSISDFSYKMFV